MLGCVIFLNIDEDVRQASYLKVFDNQLSISPTFYVQLLRQQSCAIKVQT